MSFKMWIYLCVGLRLLGLSSSTRIQIKPEPRWFFAHPINKFDTDMTYNSYRTSMACAEALSALSLWPHGKYILVYRVVR